MAPDASIKIEAMGEENSTITREGGCLTFIDFSKLGDKGSCLGYGWSGQEETFIWMVGTRSELSISPTSFSRDHWLQIMLDPFICLPYCRGQPIHVWVNGHSVGAAFVEQRCCLIVRIHAEQLCRGEPIKIVIEHSGFAVPKALGHHSDNRPLALRVFGVWFWTDGLLDEVPFCPDLGPKPPMLNLTAEEPAPLEAVKELGVETYLFGEAGNIRPHLSAGWHAGEDGFTWTSAKDAKISLPVPKIAGPILLKLTFHTPHIDDKPVPQNLIVSSKGEVLGQFQLAGFETVSLPIPPRLLIGASSLELNLYVPNAIRPRDHGINSDDRLLALAGEKLEFETIREYNHAVMTVRYPALSHLPPPQRRSELFLKMPNDLLMKALSDELKMPIEDVLKRSESLGHNCEFGCVQRKLGVEVLGLLRFGGVSLPNLLKALSDEFVGALDSSSLKYHLVRQRLNEYHVTLPCYDIRWHTYIFEENGISDDDKTKQASKLIYLRRRFYEGLTSGRKLYVLKEAYPYSLDRIMPILMILNRYGRNNLLVVSPASAGIQAGTVDLVGPGLMRGFINKFTVGDAVDEADPYAWLSILGNAWVLAGINSTNA